MSHASLAAYDAIRPQLAKREAEVLEVFLSKMATTIGGSFSSMTCRDVARVLGRERDSVSPRIGALKNKGLVVEVGARGLETLYEIVLDPQFKPGEKKPKHRFYRTAIEDAVNKLDLWLQDRGEGYEVRREAAELIRELAK